MGDRQIDASKTVYFLLQFTSSFKTKLILLNLVLSLRCMEYREEGAKSEMLIIYLN